MMFYINQNTQMRWTKPLGDGGQDASPLPPQHPPFPLKTPSFSSMVCKNAEICKTGPISMARGARRRSQRGHMFAVKTAATPQLTIE